MSRASISTGNIQMGSQYQKSKQQPVDPKAACHLLILGNFSGIKEAESTVKPIQVDRDNFDEIFARLSPSIQFEIKDEGAIKTAIKFSELDDFEPDALFENVELFSKLKAQRRRLASDASFEATALELGLIAQEKPASPTQTSEEPAATGLLDSILSETQNRVKQDSTSTIASDLIRDIVRPYSQPASNPKKADCLSTMDQAISAQLNKLLHYADFQNLESAWRGLYFLVKNLDTDANLKIFILDISKNELQHLSNTDDIKSSQLYKHIITPFHDTPGGKPWAAMLGNYIMNDAAEDIMLMERMGSLASAANITFISAASPHFVKCEKISKTPDFDDWSFSSINAIEQAWNYLRQSPQAKHLALCFPQFLLRIPYGKKSRPVETFDFEEMPEMQHDNYLWGNGIWLVAYSLGESYSLHKWQFLPGQVSEKSNLPIHVYVDDGEQTTKPCAETLLTEKAINHVRESGVIPLISIKNQDQVRLGRFFSLFAEPTLIAGNWSG